VNISNFSGHQILSYMFALFTIKFSLYSEVRDEYDGEESLGFVFCLVSLCSALFWHYTSQSKQSW